MITVTPLKKHVHSWLPFDCTVKYSTNRRSIQLSISDNESVIIYCPHATSLTVIKGVVKKYQHWVQQKLSQRSAIPAINPSRFDEDVILDRVAIWSQKMDLSPQKVRFSRAKTKWGSCSCKGVIALNRALLKAPLTIIDYIVVHELAHLTHMDHSKRFWKLVEGFYPDHKAARKWLKTYGDQLMLLL
jgi:predicted metal-dependent hydrolase